MQRLIKYFVLNLLRLFCLISFLLVSVPTSFASETFSYSGRLVYTNGSPVPGRVNLTFDLAYSNQPGVILCTEELDGVELVNGVFHVKLAFGSCNLPNILANGQTISIRVTDRTPDPDRVYSFQSIHSVPQSIMSQMAKQLVQMSAVDGQVLTWRAGKWGPENSTGATNGTVTQITATDGLSGGIITNTGTIGMLDNGVTSLKILDNTIVDADISSTAEVAQSKIKNLTTDLAAKESSIGTGSSTDYLNGTKAWNDFDQSVRNALLIAYTTGTATPIAATDNVMEAIGKLEGQIIANDTAFDNAGQWDKDGSLIFYTAGNVGIGTATPSAKLEVVGDISVSSKLRFKNSAISYVELRAPVGAGAITLTLPAALGSNGQVLSTDNSGNLSWLTPSTDSSQITDGSIVDADISSSANIAQSKIAGLTTSLGNKQDMIATSDATTYYRGDKTWQTLTTDAVPEGSRLYFTEPLVLGTDLAGFISAPGTISVSDTVLSALGKLNGNQANYVLKAGDTMTGPLAMGSQLITGLGTPTANDHAANKLYVDTQTALSASKWTASGSEIFYNAGNVGIGTNDPSMPLHITSTGWGTVLAQKSSNDNTGAEIHFYKSRGTPSAMLPVQVSDRLMGLYGAGAYSSTDVTANVAGIQMIAAENFTSTAQGTLIDFGTTATGTTTRLTRMTISPEGNVGIGTSVPQGKLDVKGTLLLSGATSGYVGLAPAAVAGSTVYTLPSADGSAGDLLKTNGAGVLSWQPPQSTTPTGTAGGDLSGTYPNPTISGLSATKISDALVDNTEFGYLNGVTSNIQSQLNSKQAEITAGTISQYWAGNKSWRNLDADVLSALLTGFSSASFLQVGDGDTVLGALGKLQGQINANDAAFDATGQWSKNLSDIYFNTGRVGVGTSAPSASSVLEVASTTQGFLPPRMTTVQRNAISSPANGLIVYDTTESDLYVYRASTWQKVSSVNAEDGVVFKVQHSTGSGTVSFTGPAVFNPNSILIDSHSAWNATENAFVAPQAGYYILGWHFYTGSPEAIGKRIYLSINDGSGYVDNVSTGNSNATLNATTVVYLGAGHKARLLIPSGFTLDTWSGNAHNSFWGARIGITAGGSDDNMGNHTASQNMKLGSNWLSSDGGNEGIRVDNVGNVGIGIATPSHPLHISKSVSGENSNLDSIALRISNPIQAYGTGGENARTGLGFGRDDIVRGAIMYGTYGLDYMDFHVTDSTLTSDAKMRITSSGNVGITAIDPSFGDTGINSTWRVLGIGGPVGTGQSLAGVTLMSNKTVPENGDRLGAIHFGNPNLPNKYAAYLDSMLEGVGGVNGVGSTMRFFTKNDNAGVAERMRISNRGYIGIGTASPQQIVHISGNSAGAGNQTGLQVGDVGTGAGPIYIIHNNPHIAGNAYYNSGWRYAGGTGKPTTIDFANGINLLVSNSPVGAAGALISDLTSGMRITPAGTVGIGTTNPGYKLDVQGGNVNSAGAYTNVSDLRLKEDILPLEDSLDKILKLRSVSYVWKDRSFDDSKQVGFIAQEVEKVFPEVVKTDDRGFKAMSYSQLVSPLVDAVKELYKKWSKDNQKIAKLEKENAILKAQNEEILKRLEKLEADRRPANK